MKKIIISIFLIIGIVAFALVGCKTTTAETTAAATTAAATTAVATTAAGKSIVGFSNLADTDVFCLLRQDSFKEASKDDATLDVKYMDANADLNTQLGQIETFIAMGAAAIIIMPVDFAGITPGIEKANAAGIPVICLGIQSEGGTYTFVGSKNVDAGRMQGVYMADTLAKNAQVVYISGDDGLYHSVERWNGFKEKCLDVRPDIKLLAKQTANYVREEGMAVTEDWITAFPKFDALIAANDQMALGALEALKGANRLEGVLISGIDGTQEACAAIKAGDLAQSIFQNAPGQAQKCYETLKSILAGNPAPETVDVPFESITIDNVADYLK